MSDYHPDGGQLFWPKFEPKCEFFVCLGKNTYGDDIKPENMCGFRIPAGKGVYIHPGTWHNGVYIHKNQMREIKTIPAAIKNFSNDEKENNEEGVENQKPAAEFFTRQGRIHARVSVSWITEFNTLVRLPMIPK